MAIDHRLWKAARCRNRVKDNNGQLYVMLDGTSCRAATVRRYFGETAVDACGLCDLCLDPPEATDVTVAAQKALSAVHRLGSRFGR